MKGVHSVYLFARVFKWKYADITWYLKFGPIINLFLLHFKFTYFCYALWYYSCTLEAFPLCIWSSVKLWHERDTAKVVTLPLVLGCSALPAPAGQAWALARSWVAVVPQRVVVVPLKASFQWLSPAPCLAGSCLPAPSCSTWANFPNIQGTKVTVFPIKSEFPPWLGVGNISQMCSSFEYVVLVS